MRLWLSALVPALQTIEALDSVAQSLLSVGQGAAPSARTRPRLREVFMGFAPFSEHVAKLEHILSDLLGVRVFMVEFEHLVHFFFSVLTQQHTFLSRLLGNHTCSTLVESALDPAVSNIQHSARIIRLRQLRLANKKLSANFTRTGSARLRSCVHG